MQDTIKIHSYFTVLNVHIDLVFMVVVVDMKLRDAEQFGVFLD